MDLHSLKKEVQMTKISLGERNLAEMSHLGLPVPPGFTITTQSCIHYLDKPGFLWFHFKEEVLKAITRLEQNW